MHRAKKQKARGWSRAEPGARFLRPSRKWHRLMWGRNRYHRVISRLHGEWGAISQEAYDPLPFLNKCIGMSRDLNKYPQMRNLLKGKPWLMCLFVAVIMQREWQMGRKHEGADGSPVLQREACQLCAVVQPFKLQRPAALRHAGQN